jgi:hypothetical protein
MNNYGRYDAITLSGAAMDVGGRNLPDDLIEWRCHNQVIVRGRRAALLTSVSWGAVAPQ